MTIDNEVTALIERVVPPQHISPFTKLLLGYIQGRHDSTPYIGEKLAMSEDLVDALMRGRGSDQIAALITLAKLNPKVVLARFRSDVSGTSAM